MPIFRLENLHDLRRPMLMIHSIQRRNHCLICSLIILLILLYIQHNDSSSLSTIERHMHHPVFPSIENLNNQMQFWNISINESYDKLIPRNAWVAVRGDQKIPGK